MSNEEIKIILERLDNLEATIEQQAADLELVATNIRRGVKVDAKQTQQKRDFDPDLCNWQNRTGSNGEYQMAKDGQDYQKLLAYLLGAEKNFAKIGGYSYWLFNDKVTVGRKPQKAKA